MANTQYAPYPMADWSSEISGGGPSGSASSVSSGSVTGNAGPGGYPGYPAGAHASTTTTTTTTSSASAGTHAAPSMTTTTTNHTAASMPPVQMQQTQVPAVTGNELSGSSGVLDLETHQPIEVVEAPASMNEAFLGSLKSMLLRNRGNFVTATFLIGTQGTTAWEGILHDVGNDYLIIFQPGRERYIACDIYSLKYIEFYDTRRRAICEDVLRQNGMDNYV